MGKPRVNLPTLSRNTTATPIDTQNVSRNHTTQNSNPVLSSTSTTRVDFPITPMFGRTPYIQITSCPYDSSLPTFSFSSLSETIRQIQASRPVKKTTLTAEQRAALYASFSPEDQDLLVDGLVTFDELRKKYEQSSTSPGQVSPVITDYSIVEYDFTCETYTEFDSIEPVTITPIVVDTVESTVNVSQPTIFDSLDEVIVSDEDFKEDAAPISSTGIIQLFVCGKEFERPDESTVSTITTVCYSTHGSDAVNTCSSQLDNGYQCAPLYDECVEDLMFSEAPLHNYKKRRRRW